MKILLRLALVLFLVLAAAAGTGAWYVSKIKATLPEIMKVGDYKPLLVSEIYARGGEKIGEFYRENRIIIPYEKMPKRLVQAFLAAEDDTFFQHGGINYLAIFRASIANLRAGRTAQGASTITQQVAKSFFLSPEKTLERKVREILLAFRLEAHLKKEEILYLYLNQIFFGEGAYGVGAAAETYFRKTVDQLTLPEMAMLGGLPQAPSRYSPSDHPDRAKERQRYVLNRMAAVGFIKPAEAAQAVNEPITVYMGKEYKAVAPFFVETIRQLLVAQLGETQVLDGGLRIFTSVDFKAQQEAQNQVREGLRAVDKRQGWRGALKHLASKAEEDGFFQETRKKLMHEKAPVRVILPEGSVKGDRPMQIAHRKDASGAIASNIPDYISKGQIVDALVLKVDDQAGLVYIRSAEMQALIDIADMAWARKPDPQVSFDRAGRVTKPSMVLKAGDVVRARVVADKFPLARLQRAPVPKPKKGRRAPPPPPLPFPAPKVDEYAMATLEQEPLAEAALLSIDQRSQDVIAMVGGFDFKRNEFNRTIQAQRQTGSSFKAIVYASALDKGYTPASMVADAPTVFGSDSDDAAPDANGEEQKKWSPHNYGNQFMGEVLFRTALIRSMNNPTVKILDDIGVDWAMEYARRLGIFSPLNNDLSLGLGSSAVTLYEMTKVFSEFGRGGKRTRPIVIHKVEDHSGKQILDSVSLDKRFEKELAPFETAFEEKRKTALAKAVAEAAAQTNTAAAAASDAGGAAGPAAKKHKSPHLFFEDPDQLISPQTAFLITSILMGTSQEEGGTALRARALERPLAAKTGTTNGYFDTWLMGYTPQIATGVWVGYDEEKSLGVGEAGGRTALPIWLEYMKFAHKDLPSESFPVPSGIVFANIDNQTGKLASGQSNQVVRQAFLQGTEPNVLSGSPASKDAKDFYKEDLAE
jgi:penicillin-binding protein 1A